MDLDDEYTSNFQIESEFTINNLLASFRQLVRNRHAFLRSFLISIKIILRFSDKVKIKEKKFKF